MGPARDGSLDAMKGALRNWYGEMRQLGLWEGNITTTEAFIFGTEHQSRTR